MIRFLYLIGVLALLFIAPWWLTLLFIIVGMVIFYFFIEGVILTILFEFLFGPPAGFMAFGPLSLSLIMALVLFIAWHLKQNLIVYN